MVKRGEVLFFEAASEMMGENIFVIVLDVMGDTATIAPLQSTGDEDTCAAEGDYLATWKKLESGESWIGAWGKREVPVAALERGSYLDICTDEKLLDDVLNDNRESDWACRWSVTDEVAGRRAVLQMNMDDIFGK